MRLIILALLFYVLFRLVKGLIRSGTGEVRGPSDGGVIDEMVQDPLCKTYIPRRDSVKRVIEGKTFFFCSDQCAARYEREREGKAEQPDGQS